MSRDYPLHATLKIHQLLQILYMDVSENSGTPKSSIFIAFSIITIHFGVPLFLETPHRSFTQQKTSHQNSSKIFHGPSAPDVGCDGPGFVGDGFGTLGNGAAGP